jgi:hypothetical protein
MFLPSICDVEQLKMRYTIDACQGTLNPAALLQVMLMREVTFGDFAKLANRRRLTPEYLAERFTDKIERPSEFFHRLFQGQYAAVVIPYRRVLAFYVSELNCHQDSVFPQPMSRGEPIRGGRQIF